MLIWVLAASMVIGLMQPFVAQAETQADRDQWSDWAKQLSGQVEKGDLEGARETLGRLSEGFSQSDLSELHLSVEAIESLSETLIEADRQLNRVVPEPTGLHRSTQRLWLAFDALSHPHEPLWHQYESILEKDIERMEKAVQQKKKDEIYRSYLSLAKSVREVEPALYVVHQPVTVQKIHSLMRFLDREVQSDPVRGPALQQGLAHLKKLLPPLFNGTKEEAAFAAVEPSPPIIPASLCLGGSIALILAYVAWRKYRVPQVIRRSVQSYRR
jgi:sporulation protein YpjB